MAKVIKYKFLAAEINHGTEETPNIEQIILDKSIECPNQASYDANYPIAEKEAIHSTIDVSGEFDPEPAPAPTLETRVGTLETDSTEMKEALEMILNGVTE